MLQIKFCPFCGSAAIIVWQGQLGAELKCLVCGNKVWIKPRVDDEGGDENDVWQES